MGLLQDVFNQDPFSAVTLTDEINTFPFVPSFIGDLGIYEEMGVSTVTVQVQMDDGTISLVNTAPRCAPGENNVPTKRRAESFIIPHIPKEDFIEACELEGILQGRSDELILKTAGSEITQRMRSMSASLDATEEWHMLGGVTGKILDADGSEIYDLFTRFGVTAVPDVTFDFAALTDGKLKTRFKQIVREVSKELKSVQATGMHVLCGDDFYDELTGSPETRQAYDRWMNGEYLRTGGMAYDNFQFAGIMFTNYQAYVNGQDFIAPDEARLFPVGVPGLFKKYYAPADRMSHLATMGLPRYAMTYPDPEDRFVKLHTQTNPLCLCTQPRTLRTLKLA